MSRREILLVKDFSARGALTVKSWPVPRGQTGLHHSWLPRFGDLCRWRGLLRFRRGGNCGDGWNLTRDGIRLGLVEGRVAGPRLRR
jgi:hypothetical protein